jgi:hypothetical protein|nr:MAG TPA: hypothetical protein [Caudoviricetes sp.]
MDRSCCGKDKEELPVYPVNKEIKTPQQRLNIIYY